jgi:hypothetical protein
MYSIAFQNLNLLTSLLLLGLLLLMPAYAGLEKKVLVKE